VVDIVNVVFKTPLHLIVAVALIGFFIVVVRRGWWQWQNRPIFDLFMISPNDYRLIGADIGGSRKTIYLGNQEVVGAPDAAFLHRHSPRGHVGEYKSRTYGGRCYQRERYQITLYMGFLKEQYGLFAVTGTIRYSDQSFAIAFDEQLFERLKALVPEVRQAQSREVPPNAIPLHKRP
jgi:hypothetical protein